MINSEEYSIILPGRIVEFFPADQTATIQICAERITHSSTSTNSVTKRTPLEGVPVQTPSGGGWSMTMPIKPGDTCLLFFSQVGYDHWLYEDKDTAGTLASLPKPWLKRQFNEDDGFALCGINTLPRAIPSYHATHSQWRGPDPTKQVISLNDDETITITSSTKLTINAPDVVINCTNADVNADAAVTVDSATADVTCSGGITATAATATVTAPTTDIVASAACNITSPLTTVNGLLTVTGLVTMAGFAISGGAAGNFGSGAMSGTGSLSINGVDVETHVHPYTWTDGAGSGNTSPPA